MEFFLYLGIALIIGFVWSNISARVQASTYLKSEEAVQRQAETERANKEKAQIAYICDLLGLTERELDLFPIKYTWHWIPKRTGGSRKLHVPDKRLKGFQRKILHRIIYKSKPHPFAYGFRKRKSIVDNARPHCHSAVVIKLDIQNFFPSVTEDQVKRYFVSAGWLPTPAEKLARVCCHEGKLPQGAPTSPAISNMILKSLDERLANLALRNNAVYSRYADDMTFSLSVDAPKTIRALIKVTQMEIAKYGFHLNFKKGKIRVLRRHQHQEICGITVNTDKPTLSRKKRRLLRSVKHKLDNDLPATMSREQLAGWENFNRMITANPDTVKILSGNSDAPVAGSI